MTDLAQRAESGHQVLEVNFFVMAQTDGQASQNTDQNTESALVLIQQKLFCIGNVL